jgi:glutamyl-tRNA synthetase
MVLSKFHLQLFYSIFLPLYYEYSHAGVTIQLMNKQLKTMHNQNPAVDPVRTRFAPSPTGHLHIGGLRTAIYSYALAKHGNGDFILRIEDTDQKREVAGSRREIEKLLKLFGIKWDGEVYVQSERVKTDIYREAATKLISAGHAFYCQCESKNAKEKFSEDLRDPCRDRGHTSGAIKLKVPEGREVKFEDYVLGKEVSWKSDDVPDATLLKSDGFPTYHLGVVVDDNDMNITHVLRGHDWMPSTPIHILVYEFLSYDRPEIGHLTDILDPTGGKLSKRKGSTTVRGLLDEGFLPSAIANFVMLLGWAPKNDRELFTLGEFVKEFDPRGFQKSNSIFNREKLSWFNGEYLRKLSVDELSTQYSKRNKKFEELDKDTKLAITKLIQTRIKTLDEFDEIGGFFTRKPKLSWDNRNGLNQKHLKIALLVLSQTATEKWDLETLNSNFMKSIDENEFKVGDFFMDLRVALTGSRFTPPVNESIIILGKEECVARIEKVLK